MSRAAKIILLSRDEGVVRHWQRAVARDKGVVVAGFHDLRLPIAASVTSIWLDLAAGELPTWDSLQWQRFVQSTPARLIACSSNPIDAEAIQALDAGCAAYCHAFADAKTLAQVKQVVDAGQVWVGPSLMRRLIQNASQVAAKASLVAPGPAWTSALTQREREVAVLAANGAANAAIAQDLSISERTVKAHLTAIFEKLQLTDRLQLALRVHGIS